MANSSLTRRFLLAFVAFDVVIAGLLIHFFLKGDVASLVADALYTVLIYLIIAVILPLAAHWRIAAWAFGFSTLIEILQLSSLPTRWGNSFPPLRLIFGTTFSVWDIVAYAVGALVALAVDFVVTQRLSQWRASRSE